MATKMAVEERFSFTYFIWSEPAPSTPSQGAGAGRGGGALKGSLGEAYIAP